MIVQIIAKKNRTSLNCILTLCTWHSGWPRLLTLDGSPRLSPGVQFPLNVPKGTKLFRPHITLSHHLSRLPAERLWKSSLCPLFPTVHQAGRLPTPWDTLVSVSPTPR